MTVRGQRILVDTGFRRRPGIPAEASVIERQNVEAGCVQRLQVTADVTVDGATGGRTEQDPVGRARSCVRESASRRMPSLVVSWMRPFSAAGSRDRERPAWKIRRDSFVHRHATELDHIIDRNQGQKAAGSQRRVPGARRLRVEDERPSAKLLSNINLPGAAPGAPSILRHHWRSVCERQTPRASGCSIVPAIAPAPHRDRLR